MRQRPKQPRGDDRSTHNWLDAPAPSVEPATDAASSLPGTTDYSIATLTVLPDVRPVARKIDRKESDDDHAAPAPSTAAPPPDAAGDAADPLKAGGAGSTTIAAPTIGSKIYNGKTLQEVSNALPEESGSVTFDIRAATHGDPITSANVTVTQAMVLPRWAERDAQCKPIQAAWDRFASALRQHEDEHVKINKQQLGSAHERYVGRAKSETQEVTTELENNTDAAGKAFDTQTGHGTTGSPPTIIDVAAKCDDKTTSGELAAALDQLQAKLEVSEPGDPDEEEADRVAEQVMRMGEPRDGSAPRLASSVGTVQRCAACEAEAEKWKASPEAQGTGRVRRQCAECEAKEQVDASSRVVDVTKSGGQPLDADTRAFMEPRFGFDFSHVRIHADSQSAEAARSINAHAYTVGSSVVFARDKYAPASADGRRLLAHELTHVVQQSPTRGSGPVVARDPAPPAPAPAPAAPAPAAPAIDAEAAAKELRAALTQSKAMVDTQREATLQIALKFGRRYAEIKAAWAKLSSRSLDDEVRALAGTKMDAGRILAYLKYGQLRLADKVFVAVAMSGTDEGTLFRLLPEVSASGGAASKEFAEDYGTEFPADGKLLNDAHTADRIAGVLGPSHLSVSGELSGADWVKGMALLTFGKVRPVDELRMAIVLAVSDGAINEAITNAARGGGGVKGANQIEKDYFKSYGDSLGDDLKNKLAPDSLKRAQLFLSGNFTARKRIQLACEGVANDWKEIWSALQDATVEEITEFRGEWDGKTGIYKDINGLTGALTTSNMDLWRIEAIFKTRAPRPGEDVGLSDLLQARGVVLNDQDTILKLVLEEPPVEEAFKKAFNTTEFREKFTAKNQGKGLERGEVLISGAWPDKLRVAAELKSLPGIRRLLLAGPSEADRKAVRDNEGLMGRLRAVDGFEELEMQLAPSDPIQRYEWLKKHVKGERLGERGADAGAALADELRELDAAVANVKDRQNLTPEERARLEALGGRAEKALGVYAQWSAEMDAVAMQALSVAAGLLVSAVTGGAGAVAVGEMLSAQFAAQAARAALANAVANVAVQAAVKGERLDLQGAQAAFFSGAVNGATNIFAAPVASAVNPAYRSAMLKAAETTAKKSFANVAPGFVQPILEGAIGNAAAAGVETAARSETWKYGFVEGVSSLAKEMFTAGTVGAATGGVMHGATEFAKASLFPHPTAPKVPGKIAEIAPPADVDHVAAQRNALGIIRSGQAPWEHWVGLASQMGEHTDAYRKAFLSARRQLAAEVCIQLEPQLEPSGLTWELRGGAELGQPLEIHLRARDAAAAGSGADPAASIQAATAKLKAAFKERYGVDERGVGIEASGQGRTADTVDPASVQAAKALAPDAEGVKKGFALEIKGLPGADGVLHELGVTPAGIRRCSDGPACLFLAESVRTRAKRITDVPADGDAAWFMKLGEYDPQIRALQSQAEGLSRRVVDTFTLPESVRAAKQAELLFEAQGVELAMTRIEHQFYGVRGTRLPAPAKSEWLPAAGSTEPVIGEGSWQPASDQHRAHRFTQAKGPVPYHNKFPNLTKWSDMDVSIRQTGTQMDFDLADQAGAAEAFRRNKYEFGTGLFGDPPPNVEAFKKYREFFEFTWHHKEDGQTMQLVPRDLHGSLPHVGGASLSRGQKVPST